MPESRYTTRDALQAETAAVEAKLMAEHLLEVGAWFAYAEAAEVARSRRLRADAIRARVSEGRADRAPRAA